MNSYKYKYLDKNDNLLCEEIVHDNMNYKFSLELEKQFYFLKDGSVETRWSYDYTRFLDTKMKFLKIVNGDYYYKVSEVYKDKEPDRDYEW